MGVDAMYTVWCDAEDCVQWIAEEPSKSEAIKVARRAGWARKRGVGWVCPDSNPDLCGAIYYGALATWCRMQPLHAGKHDWERT